MNATEREPRAAGTDDGERMAARLADLERENAELRRKNRELEAFRSLAKDMADALSAAATRADQSAR
jgi:hypothetical protein